MSHSDTSNNLPEASTKSQNDTQASLNGTLPPRPNVETFLKVLDSNDAEIAKRQNAEVKDSESPKREMIDLEMHEIRLFKSVAKAALRVGARSSDRRLFWQMIRDLRKRGMGSEGNGELTEALEAIEKDPEAMKQLAETVAERRKAAQSGHSEDVSTDG